MKITDANNLLNEFNKIKLMPKRKETFMTISGYPHYENVVSNILKFFFEDNEHGLKNLWIRSLLENVPALNGTDFQNVVVEEVFREYITDKKKRIDIVVVCDNYIVSIENKVFHHMANDLEEYAKTIAELNVADYGKTKTEVNIVLSLNKEDLDNKFPSVNNLCNITYDVLFTTIKAHIGMYVLYASSDWFIKMKDFIYTIEGLKGGNFMDLGFAKFLYDNKINVVKLLDAMDNYKDSIGKEVNGLKDALQVDADYNNFVVNNSNKYSVVSEAFTCDKKLQRLYASVFININDGNRTLTIETYIDSKGWHIVLWAKLGNKAALKAILIKNGAVESELPIAKEKWKGCEVCCVPIEDGHQKVIEKIVNDGFDAAEKVLNNKSW